MASQRFCLRWNNHQSNLLSVFDQLLHAETFTDVTLAVEGQYLKAHKMVLSACSPYFNALFVNHPEKHPIVILKDVPYSDMKSLLDFMYRGEVSVDQERLTAFLRVAESLRIKGLTEVNDDKPVGAAPTPPPPQLHRIQPYLVQQRTKVQNMLNINDNQQSLLGSALSSMPKRKRGRPRKLSGSSNGTGNDFDEYDRDGMMHDSPKHEVKISGDGYSGNEGSDENQRESCDNDQDANDCTDSRDGRIKKRKSQSKDRINNDNDNSTSDPNDSDCDDQMDASFMEPQLMLDEYDEPVEFKYDPSSSPNSQEATSAAESVAQNNQQQQQQALLVAQQKHQQQMAVAAATAAAVAKGAALISPGTVPGTVTILNTMGAIPKLTPIVKSKPKLSKRPKLKQNGLSQQDGKPLNNNDFIDMFNSNFMPGNTAPGKLKATLTIAANTQMSGTTPGGGNNSSNLSSKSSPGGGASGGGINTVSLTKMKGTGSVGGVGGGGGGDSMGSGNNIHLNNSPELSQRLFGVNKPPPPTSMAPISCASSSSNLPVISAVQSIQSTAGTSTTAQKVSNSTQIIQISSVTSANHQQQKQTVQTSAQTTIPEILDPATHLPTALGLKIRVHPVSQQQQQQQQSNHHQQPKSNKSTSSMLQQQLCNDSLSNNNNNNKNNNSCQLTAETKCNNRPSERRQSCNDSNTIQPPSSNNLHHQFLLHMATNPIVKTEYLINNEINNDENVMPIEVPSSPNSNSNAQNFKSETEGATPTIIDLVPSPTNANEEPPKIEESSPPVTPRNQRPVQRRRIRRKAQSSMDDQAEHLTEMSVRGLDLFRYASITEGVYQCTECAKENVQKTFKNKYSFQRHAFLYHEGKHRKVFPCPVCGKEFSRPDKMKNHMKMTHEGFVPKDVAYHPLNYLITAAAAGEIQHLFHQIDQNNPEANSGDCTTSNQHPSKPQSLIKLKNEIHTIHEPSPSPPPPLGTREGSIIATQEEVK